MPRLNKMRSKQSDNDLETDVGRGVFSMYERKTLSEKLEMMKKKCRFVRL